MSTNRLSSFFRSLVVCASLIASTAAGEERYTLPNGERVKPLDNFKECSICPEVVVLPLGSFLMGASHAEAWTSIWDLENEGPVAMEGPDSLYNIPTEGPQHNVEMDTPYAMAVNEVTHAEWMACVQDGACSHTPEHRVLSAFGEGWITLGPDHPVINVSLLDIQEYTAWLNGRVGADVYRLPTEAEWEYAARAGTSTRFAQGDVLTSDQANFSRLVTEHNRKRPFPEIDSPELPIPVQDLDAANSWGLRHMSGNVMEMTLSCFRGPHIGLPTNTAYLADAADGCERYAAKGGSFNMAMGGVRLATRWKPKADSRIYFGGFRLARTFSIEGFNQ